MAHEQNMTTEALARGAEPGQGYELGRTISNIFHPILLSIATFFIVGTYSGPTLLAGMGWAAFCTALQVIPGTLFFTIRMRQGAYSDEDVSVRHQRNELYLVSLCIMIVSAVVLWLLHAPLLFLALMASGLILSVVSWLINLFWKISVHAASSASCATVALLLSPVLGAMLWICVLVVGWARIRTRNHTLAQVAAGMALAAACVLVTFRALGAA